MFTWSFGCAPSPASVAITSLAFMFDDVPEPVWNTSIGNWSSWRPSAISSAAAAIRCASVAVEQPELGVRPRGRALDPAEPAHDRHRDPLSGHGEVATALRVSPPHNSSVVSSVMGNTLALTGSGGAWAHERRSARSGTPR